jgi:hypothetical protein
MAKRDFSRRTLLRGLGTAIALPFLESVSLSSAVAETVKQGVEGTAVPRRMAFIYVPNGIHMPNWTPDRTGANYSLPYSLEPLADIQQDLCVLTGLTHDKARHNGDGGGDHARSASCFLTGVQPVKTLGAGIRLGESVDQIAARHSGNQTPLSSLELGIDGGTNGGNCDSGYSCAYTKNISWRSESSPMPKETDPRVVFERLFGAGDSVSRERGLAQRTLYRRSILDFVRAQARRLERRVGVKDRRKLDEYFSSIREVERRLELVERDGERPPPEVAKPMGIPDDYATHVRLMCDMMVLAFQGDITRIATIPFARAGSNRSYTEVGVPEGHHELSHHGGDARKHEKISEINRFHIEQFAYFIERLKAIDEGHGTILDNSMILYGSGISDGNRHNHDDLPVLLAGRGGGTVDSGRHIRYELETPLTNLYVSLLDRMNVPVEVVGDSTGRLDGLTNGLPRSF